MLDLRIYELPMWDSPPELALPWDLPLEFALPWDSPPELALPWDSPPELALPWDSPLEKASDDGQGGVHHPSGRGDLCWSLCGGGRTPE